MALPPAHLLDELATAYVSILASLAGATIAVARRDYGVDGTLKQIVETPIGFSETGFPVDFQLKGTVRPERSGDEIVYDLAARNHHLLAARPNDATPYCLLLICFAEEGGKAVRIGENEISVAAEAFWFQPERSSENASTVRIRVPVGQRLTADVLSERLTAAKARFM